MIDYRKLIEALATFAPCVKAASALNDVLTRDRRSSSLLSSVLLVIMSQRAGNWLDRIPTQSKTTKLISKNGKRRLEATMGRAQKSPDAAEIFALQTVYVRLFGELINAQKICCSAVEAANLSTRTMRQENKRRNVCDGRLEEPKEKFLIPEKKSGIAGSFRINFIARFCLLTSDSLPN
jgi:uncharacterized protein YigA (DUF484 family)